MAALDAESRSVFYRDLHTAGEEARLGVTLQRAKAADAHWELWDTFCRKLTLDPLLSKIEDPVTILQVFALRYRRGTIAPNGKPVRSRTVEDALRSVGQTFAGLGAQDPRLNASGKPDFRLQRQLRLYAKADPPPNRVKPVPVPVIQQLLSIAVLAEAPEVLAVVHMIVIAFFFLLRPGEYTATTTESKPFRLQDVGLSIGRLRINPLSCPLSDLDRATFATLEFTDQKNGVRGEVIGQGRSKKPHFCPVHCIKEQVKHLRTHNAAPTTPLASYYCGARCRQVSPSAVSAALKGAVAFLGPSLGFLPKDVSARCLRASGAMALLCAKVDTDLIRLVGRWRSDEMLRYLHVQAEPVMRGFSERMLNHGSFTLHPNHEVPLA